MTTLVIVGCSQSTIQNNPVNVNQSIYRDNIVSIEQTETDKDSGSSKIIIYYKDGDQVKTFAFKSTNIAPKLVDINGDKSRKIILSKKIPIGSINYRSDLFPIWEDIYIFDTMTRQLVNVSLKLPQYYRDVYIPNINKVTENFANDGDEKIAAAANKTLAKVASEVASGNLKPDNDGQVIKQRFYELWKQEESTLYKKNPAPKYDKRSTPNDNSLMIYTVSCPHPMMGTIYTLYDSRKDLMVQSPTYIGWPGREPRVIYNSMPATFKPLFEHNPYLGTLYLENGDKIEQCTIGPWDYYRYGRPQRVQ